ncbi:unnamed protein product [Blepharisma stoltei]|uniref:MI domain-containing protein n=1 Tax=Blepharisma stoltei TaxID=1481888 RepID=A0AAU9IAA5_9CILI|nr:unnamed protein product [Blepharisma stoltei]
MSKFSSDYQLNVKASEFTPVGLISPDISALNPHAYAFEPENLKPDSSSLKEESKSLESEEIPIQPIEEAKSSQPKPKVYSISFLLTLRTLCTELPSNVSIPDPYNLSSKKHRKRSKKSKKGEGQKIDDEIKPQESVFTSCPILVKTEKPLSEKLKKEVSDLEKSARRIRLILNKLSPENLEKLGNSLVEDFEYNYELLQELVKFIFERATAQSFAAMYASLCGYLTKKFKAEDPDLSRGFKVKLVEKCRECFYKEDEPQQGDALMDAEYKRRRRLIGNIKFIGLLFKQRMIKTDIMFECFDVLIKPETLSDETIETCCHLFKECSNLLAARQVEKLNEYFEKIAELTNNARLSKRICFMIQDIVESKAILMTPIQKVNVSTVKSSEDTVVRKIGKVKFADEEEEKELQSPTVPKPSILKMIVSEETKAELKLIIRNFIQDRDVEKAIEKLAPVFHRNSEKHRQLVYQIIKYVICEYSHIGEFDAICELFHRFMSISHISGEIIETGIVITIEALSDIKLDSPNAAHDLEHIIHQFQVIGVLNDTQSLLKHIIE